MHIEKNCGYRSEREISSAIWKTLSCSNSNIKTSVLTFFRHFIIEIMTGIYVRNCVEVQPQLFVYG
jgi:hypothetical protein